MPVNELNSAGNAEVAKPKKAKRARKNAAPRDPKTAVRSVLVELQATLTTAIAALDRTQVDSGTLAEYARRTGFGLSSSLRSLTEEIILHANLSPGKPPRIYPGAYGSTTPRSEALARLKSNLVDTPPPTPDACTADDVCMVLHSELPTQHTPQWAAWKRSAADHLRCPGQQFALEQRKAIALEHATALAETYGADVTINDYGDLTVPTTIDPWPDAHVGMLDKHRYRVVERHAWGYTPDDVAPQRAREHQGTWYGFSIGHAMECIEHHGLRLLTVREFVPPSRGEAVALSFVPFGDLYQPCSGGRVRAKTADDRNDETVVLYVGPDEDRQLDLLGAPNA